MPPQRQIRNNAKQNNSALEGNGDSNVVAMLEQEGESKHEDSDNDDAERHIIQSMDESADGKDAKENNSSHAVAAEEEGDNYLEQRLPSAANWDLFEAKCGNN
jgi:hypothetical protein